MLAGQHWVQQGKATDMQHATAGATDITTTVRCTSRAKALVLLAAAAAPPCLSACDLAASAAAVAAPRGLLARRCQHSTTISKALGLLLLLLWLEGGQCPLLPHCNTSSTIP
jgi:hypothetical protein